MLDVIKANGGLGVKKYFCGLAIVLLIIVAIFVVVLALSRGEELALGSMRDVELDVIISIGDSRERVIELLGEPFYVHDVHRACEHCILTFFEYESGMRIAFIDDTVVSIRGTRWLTVPDSEYGERMTELGRTWSNEDRFEIRGYTVGMTREEISSAFNFDRWRSHDMQNVLGDMVFIYYRIPLVSRRSYLFT